MKLWFQHGWGFDASIWGELRNAFPYAEASFADRGYFGGEGAQAVEEPAIWITHSFGAMLALDQMNANCRALIAINGFDRFTSGDGASGVSPRVLQRMIKRFGNAPEQVVTDFREKCGCTEAIAGLDAAALERDLIAMAEMDCREKTAQLQVPMLALQGGNDHILPAEMRREVCARAPVIQRVTHPEAGHLLPFEDTIWCAAQITAFIEEKLG